MSDPGMSEETREPGWASREARRPPVPRWVKVFGIIALVLLLLAVVLLIVGGHEPKSHF
jgi:hypothetical protein